MPYNGKFWLSANFGSHLKSLLETFFHKLLNMQLQQIVQIKRSKFKPIHFLSEVTIFYNHQYNCYIVYIGWANKVFEFSPIQTGSWKVWHKIQMHNPNVPFTLCKLHRKGKCRWKQVIYLPLVLRQVFCWYD